MTLDGSLEALVDDDTVRFEFTVTNVGNEAETLSFRSALRADVAAFADDEERWRWSDGRMFAQMLQSETLSSGEQTTYEMTWDDPVTGEYTAVVTLEADGHDLEARTTFAVD